MAQMPFSPCDSSSNACTDASIDILRRIFGGVVDALVSGADPNTVEASSNILATMFSFFNSGILIVGSLIVSYVAIMGTLNTANDGEAMGRDWSSLWTPIRIVAGGAVLLPTTSGFSFVQLVMLLFALWGVGFANGVYKTGLALGVLSPEGVVAGVNQPGTFYGLRDFARQYLAASYCARAANSIYGDSGLTPDVGARKDRTADKTVLIDGRIESMFYIQDRNPATNLAGGQPVCGVIKIGDYVAQQRPDHIGQALEQLRANVQEKKIDAAQRMMNELDSWVNTWPAAIDNTGWERVNSDRFNQIVNTAELSVANALMRQVANDQSGVDAGIAAFADSLTADGWAMAGGWFQRVGMVRGQIATVLSEPVGSVSAPSLSALPPDARAALLINSVTTVVEAVSAKAEQKPSYRTSQTVKPEDLASLIPKSPQSDINPGSIKADMDAKMSSFVNRTMQNVVDIATGAGGNGQTSLCGTAGQIGGSLNRMKCVGDYLAVARGGIAVADVAIKTAATGLRVVAGTLSSVKGIGTGLDLDKIATPLWDWIIEVPIEQLALLASYIEPLAFYFGVFLPSLPYAIFMIVVVGWLLAVLQAIIAAPLWAVMHMTPDRSFIGSQTQGYLLVLALFARPALAVVGLFAAVLVADPIISYIAKGFFTMRGAVVSSTGGVGAIAEFLTFAWWFMVFGLVLLPVLYMVFGLPQVLPDHVLRWIGAGIHDLGETNAIGQVRSGITSAAPLPSLPRRGRSEQIAPPKAPLLSGPSGGREAGDPREPVNVNPQGITPVLSDGAANSTSPTAHRRTRDRTAHRDTAAQGESHGRRASTSVLSAGTAGATDTTASVKASDGDYRQAIQIAARKSKAAYHEVAAAELAAYKADLHGEPVVSGGSPATGAVDRDYDSRYAPPPVAPSGANGADGVLPQVSAIGSTVTDNSLKKGT